MSMRSRVNMMKTKKMVYMALLTAIALGLFVIESQIPALVPIPGVKLGLANIITVYALFTLSPVNAATILAARILLGAAVTGNISGLLYSAAGGILCLLCMIPLTRILTKKQMWLCSAAGAVFHNVGQILMAALVTGTTVVFAYLPALLVTGIIAGLFTGICAQFIVNRVDKHIKFKR